jgi:type 1 glutamine amidotransferase
MLGATLTTVNSMKKWWLVSAVMMIAFALGAEVGWGAPRRVLILPGSNNHDWRATTPVLKELIESTGAFAVDVETNVPAMTEKSFASYDVVLSNFNTFGHKNPGPVWSDAIRAAFIAHVKSGKGLVTVHSGSSVFYDWPEFQQLAGTSWGKNTSHGQRHSNDVVIVDHDHPITRGLASFPTFDEFWQSPPLADGVHVLATVTPSKDLGCSGKSEPTAMVTKLGDGRGFTLLLGHDVRAMRSDGFRTLLLRGVEWVATGDVSKNK